MADVVKTLPKDPNAVLSYGIDWSDWLASGEEISTSVWTVTGDDALLVSADPDLGATSTLTWLSGGTVGVTYEVTNRITTTDGATEDRTIEIIVKER